VSVPIPSWFVTDAVRRFDLRPNEVAVYVCLAHHANAKTRRAWPSQQTIAAEMGINPRTARRALDRLEEVGLIEKYVEGIPGRSARYLLPAELPIPKWRHPAPTTRSEWSDEVNGYRSIPTQTSASGPEVEGRLGSKRDSGITRQNRATSASRPPEGKGAFLSLPRSGGLTAAESDEDEPDTHHLLEALSLPQHHSSMHIDARSEAERGGPAGEAAQPEHAPGIRQQAVTSP